MKQLKIIANEYNNENGLMQVNFNEQILVKPGSKIAMDKFTMDVNGKGATSDIVLPAQIVNINCDVPTQDNRSITIPAGTYATINDVLQAWNQQSNSILETSMLLNVQVPDNGLYFGSNLATTAPNTGHVQLLWGGCPMVALSDSNTDLSGITDINNAFVPDLPALAVVNEYTLGTTTPLVLGGVDCRFRLQQTNQADPNNYSTYTFGLLEQVDANTSILQYGIKRMDGNFYIVNGASSTEITGDAAFYNDTYTSQFFVEGGELRFQIVSGGGVQQFITPAGSFNGFNFNTSYFFTILGSYTGNASNIVTIPIFLAPEVIFQTNISELNTGFIYDFTSFIQQNHLFITGIPGVENRIVSFNFEECPLLQEGLGFSAVYYQNTNPQPNNVITAENNPSFQIYYDLALDIPSVQLESYIASTDRGVGALSGRKNYISYFVPQRVEGNKNIYVFNSTKLDFVDMSLRQDTDLNSMQFRVLFPAVPTAILEVKFLSFNLYIEEPASL